MVEDICLVTIVWDIEGEELARGSVGAEVGGVNSGCPVVPSLALLYVSDVLAGNIVLGAANEDVPVLALHPDDKVVPFVL